MRRRKVGLAVAAGIALTAAAAVVLVPGGSAAQEAPSSDQATRARQTQTGEPEFKPGIPGLKMADVRAHKHLWREIEELQGWERTERISIAEYRSKVMEKTAHFLGYEGPAAQEFARVASEAVAAIRESFLKGRSASASARPPATWSCDGAYFPEGSTHGTTSAANAQFHSDMAGAVTRVASLLKNEPRHQLFAPECKKWLLKLAFGPSEAEEAKQARAGKAAKPR